MGENTEWRAKFLKVCGPGLLAGITWSDWRTLLRERGRTIDPSRWLRAQSITAQAVKNSFWAKLEQQKYGAVLEKVEVEPPLFILGHWRSGTTHLHELMSQDDRFGYPIGYETSFPHTCLTTGRFGVRMLSFFIPRGRPMDEMAMSLTRAQEDEFALCVTTFKSPCMVFLFPSSAKDFERYLTLESLTPEELAEWRKAFLDFLKKVQWRCGRTLVLKSPPHTARIRILLEMFPKAKFVHIHRDPYRVFQSSRHTFSILFSWNGLQKPTNLDLDELVVRQYADMHRAFFEQKRLVPAGQFYEMQFEELEKDPVGELKKMYAALELPDFKRCEPAVRRYLDSVIGYRKNVLSELASEEKNRLAREWAQSFEAWGYST